MDDIVEGRFNLTPDADTRKDSDNAYIHAGDLGLWAWHNFHRVVYPSGRNLNLSRFAKKQNAWRTTEVLHEIEVAALVM